MPTYQTLRTSTTIRVDKPDLSCFTPAPPAPPKPRGRPPKPKVATIRITAHPSQDWVMVEGYVPRDMGELLVKLLNNMEVPAQAVSCCHGCT